MGVKNGKDAVCGIDVGTQGVRAVVAAQDGTLLGTGRAALTSSRRPAPDRHEQDPVEWVQALVAAVREAVAAASASGPLTIGSVALDGTSGTVVVGHAAGAARGPALMYDDARASEEAHRVQQVGQELWTSLGYRMQPSWALPKLVWLQEHGAVGLGDRVLHQADYLIEQLTGGTVATDTSTALKTGADLREVCWPDAVFDELGVAGLLPPLVLPGTVLGRVSGEAAAATGLTEGAVVRAGMTDGCAAQVASGALRRGQWSSALGTTLVIKGSTTQLLHDPTGAVYCHRHPDGGWLPGGASSSGAGALAAALPGADLDALTRVAQQRPVPGGVSYPLSGHGERFPFVAPDATGFLSAQAVTDSDKFASLCLAIALVERLAYDTLAALGADVSGSVALTGGASRNAWWNQMRCDVLGRSAVLPASGEAAVGAAVLAAAEPGTLTATAQRMVRVVDHLEPDAGRHAEYSARYAEFVAELADRGWLQRELAKPISLSRVDGTGARP
jgi:sugar (pentulose or hexulose) kinase